MQPFQIRLGAAIDIARIRTSNWHRMAKIVIGPTFTKRVLDRVRSRVGLKGELEPDAAPTFAAASEDLPFSDEEIARIKIYLAEFRRPREPATGPDGLPIPAPPPPVFEDETPVRDDRPELPTDRERTIPGH